MGAYLGYNFQTFVWKLLSWSLEVALTHEEWVLAWDTTVQKHTAYKMYNQQQNNTLQTKKTETCPSTIATESECRDKRSDLAT